MTSHSSHEQQSTHPYHDEWHQSQTSLQSTERQRTLFSWLKSTFRQEDLPPLPEGSHLSSSSPPPALPVLPSISFDLPPLFPMTPLPSTRYNSSWNAIAAAGSCLLSVAPSTILGIEESEMPPLHHPCSHTILATSGITLPFPSMPTSPSDAFSVPQTIIQVSSSGTSLYRTRSSHPSLYQPLWNQSPDHPIQSDLPGNRSMSDILHHDPPLLSGSIPVLLSTTTLDLIHHSTNSGSQSGLAGGQASQATQTPPQSYSLRWSTSMESMEKVLWPPSRKATPRQLPNPPPMTLKRLCVRRLEMQQRRRH